MDDRIELLKCTKTERALIRDELMAPPEGLALMYVGLNPDGTYSMTVRDVVFEAHTPTALLQDLIGIIQEN